MLGGWKTIAGMMLISVGNLLRTHDGYASIGDLLIAVGTVLAGIGVEHKSRKLDTQIKNLTEEMKKLETPSA